MNIVKVIDFTGEGHSNDQNGYGTFVAGMISSTNPDCFGIAPDAEIYILKLFTGYDITYSSWFIDAFNWVLDNDIDIVNLSTTSKDSKDIPFIDKLDELIAAGIIVVSAVGNDGPIQGSVENPGDLSTVIGSGSLSA
jgi:membrane-bound transcription factor site-1 protease